MTSQQILQSDLLDILFEKRNKMYGAYRLRRTYNLHLLKAIGGTTLLMLSLLFVSSSSSEKIKPEKPQDDFKLTTVVMPAEKKPDIPQQKKVETAAQKPLKQDVFTTQIKVVDEVINPVATQKDFENIGVGNIKVDGPQTGFPSAPQLPPNNGGGNLEKVIDKNETPLPSRQPQFPGGTDAWLTFLNRHLRPPEDMEPGEKRSSHIRFSVDEQGVITNFQVVQSGGSEFDNEVIRVLKKMPKWLPALQSGKPVTVSFTQPVTFVASE